MYEKNTKNKMKKYSVLLYYCYTQIDNTESFREAHHIYCIEKKLLGRIIIAQEGINGTVSGLVENCQEYMEHLKADKRFAHIEFKIEYVDFHVFKKIHVRIKREIVHSGLPYINPIQKTGAYIEPKEMHSILKNNEKDTVLLDVRSKYEYSVGKFKNAITLDIENFRELKEKIDVLKKTIQNKKIITYCTGGIKCEKASAYLLENGFENVYQLHGGIIKYGIEADGEYFEGKCYVFDSRIAVDVNKINPTIVGSCYVCKKICDKMINCANPTCNKHVPICKECAEKLEGTCSAECQQNPHKRPYDGTGYYQKNTNGYNPYKDVVKKKTPTSYNNISNN